MMRGWMWGRMMWRWMRRRMMRCGMRRWMRCRMMWGWMRCRMMRRWMRRVVRVEVMEDIVQTVFQMRVEHRRHPFQLGLVSKIVGSG